MGAHAGQEPGRGADEEPWLALCALLNLLPYIVQDHRLRNDTTYNGPGPPTSIAS